MGYPFRFVELAQEINAGMPSYVAWRIQDQLNVDGKPLRGSVVLLLGVTDKPDLGDTRESPAVPRAKTLLQHGAQLRFHDPLVKQFAVSGYEVARVDVYESLAEADIASCCKIIAVMTSKRWPRSHGVYIDAAVKIKYAGVDDEVIAVDVHRIPVVEALRHFNAYLILVSLSSCRMSLIDSGFPRGAGNS
jgi:UDP-glucose 6-dehydrogenase